LFILLVELAPDLTRGTLGEPKQQTFDNGIFGQKGSALSYTLPPENAFRPINQAYMIQAPPSYQLTGQHSRGNNIHYADDR